MAIRKETETIDSRHASIDEEIARRRTFAIISHPDAGKTTVTEKFLLHGQAIQLAGTVKARKSGRMAKSDWMAMEQQRGISVTTSVMQFDYRGRVVNLLDTPGHADFSEDTYRTLTAVDSAIMVIDASKGVEPRTRKLLEICRMRATPIITFINKLDRESMDPIALLDQIESELNIECTARNWPIGSGQSFRGIYDIANDAISVYERGHAAEIHNFNTIQRLESEEAKAWLGGNYEDFGDEIDLIKGASHGFELAAYLDGSRTPVFFGSALQNFGVEPLLNEFVSIGPGPQTRETDKELIDSQDNDFSGFVFKIQANMDPKHRDRIAFVRVCSGRYKKGMQMHHVRIQRNIKASDALIFMAGDRKSVDVAVAGDIIGLHNHGTIRIGDTFTAGETFNFKGIPNFAPELFKRAVVKDPSNQKKFATGITQLSEEGATQVFFPVDNNDVIVGAIGSLQFDLVAHRLNGEYAAECLYEPSNIYTVRWVSCSDTAKLHDFRQKVKRQLALDGDGLLTFLASSRANLRLIQDRWPEIEFFETREHGISISN